MRRMSVTRPERDRRSAGSFLLCGQWLRSLEAPWWNIERASAFPAALTRGTLTECVEVRMRSGLRAAVALAAILLTETSCRSDSVTSASSPQELHLILTPAMESGTCTNTAG